MTNISTTYNVLASLIRNQHDADILQSVAELHQSTNSADFIEVLQDIQHKVRQSQDHQNKRRGVIRDISDLILQVAQIAVASHMENGSRITINVANYLHSIDALMTAAADRFCIQFQRASGERGGDYEVQAVISDELAAPFDLETVAIELIVNNDDGEDYGYLTDPESIYSCHITALQHLDLERLENIRDRLIGVVWTMGINSQAILVEEEANVA